MKKKMCICLVLSVLLLAGCATGGGNKKETADLNKIEAIYIDHGSTNVHINSVNQSQLEASHSKLIMDKRKKEISIKLEKSFFNIGPKMNFNKNLHVNIPKDYKGKIFINGGSGNITSEELETEHIEATTKSGNISLEFADFHSDVFAQTASGNVNLLLHEKEEPDIQLTTKTASGQQIISVPLFIKHGDKKRIEGKGGKGLYQVDIETASGNITVQ
ncbi:DUF4097 and DUF4098 domain-containing protein YvlB [Bacillus thermophilus]|uniref:DUF4097 and DUF4098 domain-containing protein YvlB n=1 Tax=Siminovitchia thermophila TaxID=1245522 RepID=A0ABS2RAS1_9BACI|nr:DUF4097 family beta strand repeat-containing protein [Siminovitchia thermophila]MBM7715948.1 DUF4097 and DUF4098 domain-containing protein YvlB [Siminovitchia thermophila]ONK21579.1 hypothetical protein BLX87_20345 [Bacillus sp. VT-16-64]